MSLFGKKDDQKKSEGDKKQSAVLKEDKKSQTKKEKAVHGRAGRVAAAKVLKNPRITEKAHAASEKNEYVFEVSLVASKNAVRKAVEELYDVHVEHVTTSRSKPKKRRYGKTVGYTRSAKRAYVTIRKGEKIDLFS